MSSITERPRTPAERETLAKEVKRSRFLRAWLGAAENAVLTWAVLTLLLVFLLMAVGWVGRTFFDPNFDTRFGFKSLAFLWVLGSGSVLFFAYGIVLSVKQLKNQLKYARDLRQDLRAGVVREQRIRFVEAKRFQEPEHGGLIYAFRTDDDKVFVVYDEESQNLGVNSENPLDSPFQACAELLLTTSPNANYQFERTFSGNPLDAGEPREMSLNPNLWPESDEFCDVAWDKLDTKWSE